MIAPSVVQQLEGERDRLLADLARVDDAIAVLTDGQRPTPAERPRGGRPVKKAPPRRVAPGRGKASTKHVDGKRTGRAPAWDVAKAEQLWKTKPDMTAAEIADRVGASEASVYARAAKYWGPRPKKATAGGSRKCKACGSTVAADRDSCPSCGIPA